MRSAHCPSLAPHKSYREKKLMLTDGVTPPCMRTRRRNGLARGSGTDTPFQNPPFDSSLTVLGPKTLLKQTIDLFNGRRLH